MPRFIKNSVPDKVDYNSPEAPSSVFNPTKPESIDDGKVVKEITSENYIQGTQGWKIDGRGDAEFNNVVARGTIISESGNIAGFDISDNTISKGDLTLSSEGFVGIKATSYNDEGVWLGIDNDTPKLSIYKDSDNYLRFDGDTVEIAGSISVTSSDNLKDLAFKDIIDSSGDVADGVITADKIAIGSVKDIDSDSAVLDDIITDYNDLDNLPTLGDVSELNNIDSTYITDGAVITSKVASGAIVADKIDVNDLFAESITVNNGGDIKSENYSSGSDGWRIEDGGSAEFNNVVVRGTVEATSGFIEDLSLKGDLTIEGNMTMSGSPYIRSAEPGNSRFFLEGGSSPELRFDKDGQTRMKLLEDRIQFITADADDAGSIEGLALFGGSTPLLDINSSLQVKDVLYVSGVQSEGDISLQSDNYINFTQDRATFNEIRFNSDSKDPQNNNDANNLEIKGDEDGVAFYTSNSNGYFVFVVDGDVESYIDSSGDYVNSSDIRYKENVKDIENDDYKFIYDITPISYTKRSNQEYGFSAQEVKKYNDNIVRGEEEGMLSLSYLAFIPFIVKGMQDLNERISQLEKKVL